MASEIKVDTIVNAGGDNDTGIDLATNDQILLKVANATRLTMNSTGQTTIVGEGGTTTTSVQQGLCKVWVAYDAESTVTKDSFNVSSQSDDAVGRTTTTFTNSFSNDDWSLTGQVFDGTGANDVRTLNHDFGTDTYTSSAVKYYQLDASNNLNDPFRFFIHIHGDLA